MGFNSGFKGLIWNRRQNLRRSDHEESKLESV